MIARRWDSRQMTVHSELISRSDDLRDYFGIADHMRLKAAASASKANSFED